MLCCPQQLKQRWRMFYFRICNKWGGFQSQVGSARRKLLLCEKRPNLRLAILWQNSLDGKQGRTLNLVSSLSSVALRHTGEREPGKGERRPAEGGQAADGGGQVPVIGAEQSRAPVHGPERSDSRAPLPTPPQQLPQPAHPSTTLPALTGAAARDLWPRRTKILWLCPQMFFFFFCFHLLFFSSKLTGQYVWQCMEPKL